MKRKLALLILVIIAVSVALVACNQPDATTADVRWNEEKHVFTINKADFLQSSGDYRKDAAMTAEVLQSKDEIIPEDVCGSYVLTITPTAGMTASCVVTTEQVIYALYYKSDVNSPKLSEEDFNTLVSKVSQEEIAQTGFDVKENQVVFKSVTKSEVMFETPSQRPTSSMTKVDGFYAGKKHCNVTNYEVSTVYDYSNEKKPTATVTIDSQEETYNLPAKTSTVDVIDSNQLLVYLRSLAKTKTSLQDSKSARVFNAYTGEIHTASFAFLKYEDKVILTDYNAEGETPKTLNVTLSSVAVTVDGIAYMLQDNLPSLENLDYYVGAFGNVPKYTTVRFRVGYLSYEIDYSNEANTTNWEEIWEALTPATKPEEGEEEQTPEEE